MGKPGKWLRNFLRGKPEKKKDKEKNNTIQENSTPIVETPSTPIAIRPTTPKEKRRWSFRRPSAAAKDSNSADVSNPKSALLSTLDIEDEQKKQVMAMAAATAAAADAAAAAAQATATVIRLTAAATVTSGQSSAIEEVAAIKIQSVFRAHLARKALCALRGLVKLQALVRGHLVRKQATATLRCMQALVTVQARAQAHRIRMAEEGKHRQSPHGKSSQENRYRHSNYDVDRGMEENIKIVEMDYGDAKGSTKGRKSYSHHPQTERREHRISTHYPPSNRGNLKQDNSQVSPADASPPRGCSSSHFEEFSFSTAQSSPQCYSAVSKPDPSRAPFAMPRPDYTESLSYDHPLYPNYMANTESSRAKARSQSAPKQRPPDSFERQTSRRRPSLEGRNVPRVVRMQRSSSQIGSSAQNYQYPWLIKLDKSMVSLKDSECGSTSTMLTNTNYCRSLVGFEYSRS